MSTERATVLRFPTERRHPRRLLPLSELCAQFSYSERWFRYRLAEGMPAHKYGGRLRFDAIEVERWLKERYGN